MEIGTVDIAFPTKDPILGGTGGPITVTWCQGFPGRGTLGYSKKVEGPWETPSRQGDPRIL